MTRDCIEGSKVAQLDDQACNRQNDRRIWPDSIMELSARIYTSTE